MSGGEMRETEKGEDMVGEEWFGRGCGFNVVTHVSTAEMVSSYHGVYSFVFVQIFLLKGQLMMM
jgi:hypothetical protein